MRCQKVTASRGMDGKWNRSREKWVDGKRKIYYKKKEI